MITPLCYTEGKDHKIRRHPGSCYSQFPPPPPKNGEAKICASTAPLACPTDPLFLNSKHFQPMLRYQRKFGLIRGKKKRTSAHLPLFLFAHCGSLRSLGRSRLFLTFSSLFSAPRWEENGGRGLLRGPAPLGVAGPWVRAPWETLARISKPQSSGPGAPPLAGQRVRGGRGF